MLEFKQTAAKLLNFALFYIDPDTGKMRPVKYTMKVLIKNPTRPGTKEITVIFLSLL